MTDNTDRAAKVQRVREIAAGMTLSDVRSAISAVVREARVESAQRSLVAAKHLLPGTFTPGRWGHTSRSAAADLLAAATAAGISAQESLAARTLPSLMSDDEAEAVLASLGI